MSELSFCLEAAALHDEDGSALADAIERYVHAGMPMRRAQLAAIADVVADVRAEREQIHAAVREQHPGVVEAAEKARQEAQKPAAQPEPEKPEPAVASRGPGDLLHGSRLPAVQDAVHMLTRGWERATNVHVIESMDDAPPKARKDFEAQQSQGAVGRIDGFHLHGQVYLVANEFHSVADVRKVLYHEMLGHYGLRGVFGASLDPVLEATAHALPQDLQRKVKEYGLDLADPAQRRMAAEELLAEMAQSRPDLGVVQRAVAAIRTFLREHGIDSLKMSREEIIRDFILPARGFVERGIQPADTDGVQFHRAFHGSPHDFEEVTDLIGTGTFSPKNEAILKALKDDDWLGFDHPAQAISAALSDRLENFDASPALHKAVEDAQSDATHNLVVFHDRNVKITHKDGTPVTQAERDEAMAPGQNARPEVVGDDDMRFSRKGTTEATADMPATAPIGTWSRAKSVVSDLIDEGLSRIGAYRLAAPMSEGSVRAQAVAQNFANAERVARQQWQRIGSLLEKHFTPEQRREMWNAADEQNTLLQEGKPTTGRGLERLSPEQRDAVEQLHVYGEELLRRAKAVGMFEGEGLPYWTPRMMVMVDGNGEYARPGSEPGKKQTSGGDGRNVFTSSSNLKQRKYLTAAETEAAMQSKGGELVRDIMTMPLAMQRLERAIAGRELINQIKDLGRATGQPTVATGRPDHEGWFTLDHAAFTTFQPRFEKDEATGKMHVLQDEKGNPVFDRVPLYMSKEFEGPVKAILSNNDGALYRAYMLLKSKAMSALMFSPLIHNLVIFGRALGYDPTMAGTVGLYVRGHAARQDNELVRTAIGAGMVPMGYHRQGMQDITDVARGFGKEGGLLDPAESWVAHGARAIVGAVNKDAGEAAKRFVDKAGDFWHGTLLWDRVADLQMGIFDHANQRLQAKGFEPGVANTMAAHWANRYAGAVARENMGEYARKAANVLLFSRSFNMGNLGTIKDLAYGMPSGLRAKIEAEYGRASASKAFTEARRKAWAGFIADAAMSLIALSVAQSAVDRLRKDKGWDEIFGGYADRARAMWENIKAHPASAKAYSPWQLSPTHDNEPGKQDRVDMGQLPDAGGRHEYMRLPTGKVVEDLFNWTTHFPTTFEAKSSPLAKSVWTALTNDKGFGVPVYDPNGSVSAGALDVAKHLAKSETPWDTIVTAWDKLHGKTSAIEDDKLVGNATGFTYSQGHPQGPEAGVAAEVEDRIKAQKMMAMEDVKRLLKYDHEDQAREKLEAIGLSPREVTQMIKHIQEPSEGMTRNQQKRFNQHGTEEDQERMDRVTR